MKCRRCDLDFIPHDSRQVFCSDKCQRKYAYEHSKYRISVCRHCGKSFRPKAEDRTVYCSRDCYFAGKTKRKEERLKEEALKKERGIPCKICGKMFIPNKTQRICSVKCRKEKERRRAFNKNSIKKIKVKRCKECGKWFVSEYGDKRWVYCGYECLRRCMRRQRRQKERARLRTVKIENVSAVEVFMRDGWICQICYKRLKSKDRGKTIDSAPELDHIIPLSEGGAHSYKNTQCLCRKCNNEKGNKEHGQLRLFG